MNNDLNFEKRKFVYFVTLPVMWCITLWVMAKKKIFEKLSRKVKTNFLFFDGLSDQCREIKEGSGSCKNSWKSLKIIYNFRPEFGSERGFIRDLVAIYWIGMMNAQAVRNRLKIVTEEVKRAIRYIYCHGRHVQILSIAAGSASSVIEAISATRGINSKAVLVDISRDALEESENAAKKEFIAKRCIFKRINILKAERIPEMEFPDIIEMVGLLDYLDNETIIQLIKKLYDWLPEEGILLTGHICSNPERYFLKWVIDWDMKYRNAGELTNLLVLGGFTRKKIEILVEPHGIHMVAVCKK